MRQKQIQILNCTDDAMIIANNGNDLQILLKEFHTTAEKFNLEIDTEKTKTFVISKYSIGGKLVVENKIIEQVMETYLN